MSNDIEVIDAEPIDIARKVPMPLWVRVRISASLRGLVRWQFERALDAELKELRKEAIRRAELDWGMK